MLMEITENEADLIASMRKSQPPPWNHVRRMGRKPLEYPHVYRDEDGVKVVKRSAEKHAGFEVYLNGELMCICMYKKGAVNVSDYIISVEQSRREQCR